MFLSIRPLAAAVLALASQAHAATLTVTGTADDEFSVYLSTHLSAPGLAVFDKTSGWGSVESSAPITLSAGQSVYLMVDARNVYGGPAMLLADFAISGSGFQFANGLSTLATDTTHWTVSETSFAAATGTPVSMGANVPGLQIWGNQTAVSSSAEAVWAYNADWSHGYNGHAYFVTQISAVPEPQSVALMLAGLGLLGAVARRSRR